MPYAIQEDDGKFKVVNKETGRVLGTHKTREAAEAQIAAIHASGAHGAAEGAVVVSAEDLLKKGWDESHSEG